MRTMTIRLNDMALANIQLGFVGESSHTKIIFDCKTIFDVHPNATWILTVNPPEGEQYNVPTMRIGNTVTWTVDSTDVAVEGDGTIQMTFSENDEVIKTYVANTTVEESISPGGGGGGGGGTDNYNDLNNKPQINGITLTGNKTLTGLGIHNVPSGGSSNQVLAKNSSADHDLKWVDQSGGAEIDDTAGEGDTGVVWSADKTWTETEELKEAIENVDGNVDSIIEGGVVEATVTKNVDFSNAENGYVNSSGSMIGTTIYVHTKPFNLKSGNRIDIKVRGYSQGATILSVLAKVTQSGYESLVNSVEEAAVKDYTYTAQADMTCIISYRAANDHQATITGTESVDVSQSITRKPHYVKRDGNSVFIKSFYSDDEDIVVEITKAGGNNLPNPKDIFTVAKTGDIMDETLSPSRHLLSRYTDWFSPHQVRAVENADGTDPNTVIFTGGNHRSNNSSSGGVATAENTLFEVLCDGVKLADGEERFCFTVAINITNEICGYNTWKTDGTGRKILKEQIRISMGESAKMECELIHTAEEAVQRLRYYGLQCVMDAYTTGIQYLGGTNRAKNVITENSNCGNKTCRNGRMISPTGDIMLTHMDDVDLGSFAYSTASDNSYFSTGTAKKAYYSLINNDGTNQNIFNQDEGEITCARGWYDWVFSPSDVAPQS